MKKPIYVLTTIAFVALIATIAWAMNQSPTTTTTATNTNETSTIVDMFKQGLKTSKESNSNTPDADMFGAALVSIALERLSNNPDVAPQMFAALEQHLIGTPPREQYSSWDVFLENLEAALLKSRDAEHLKANWMIRQKAIEKQATALKTWANTTGKKLDTYAKDISELTKLDDINPLEPDVQESIEFLLGEAESVGFDNTELHNKAAKIAKIIDDKLADIVTKFEQDVETERQRDLSEIVSPTLDEAESKGNDKVWKNGRYQELLDEFFPIVQLRENPAVTFWVPYRQDDSEDESDDASFFERLVSTYQEAGRLQRIRYSLHAVRILSNDSSITQISHIDPGFLESATSALYSLRENELMTQRPNERSRDVREILLRSKLPLSAF